MKKIISLFIIGLASIIIECEEVEEEAKPIEWVEWELMCMTHEREPNYQEYLEYAENAYNGMCLEGDEVDVLDAQ